MKKVLLVDDEKDLLEVYKFLLEQEKDVSVISVNNAEEAIKIAETTDIDFAIIDVNLGYGDLTGFDVAKAVKKSNEKCLVSITSGDCDVNLNKLNFNFLFLAKPFDTEQMIKFVGE